MPYIEESKPRRCLFCGELLERGQLEATGKWQARQYCDRICNEAHRLGMSNRPGYVEEKPEGACPTPRCDGYCVDGASHCFKCLDNPQRRREMEERAAGRVIYSRSKK